ncbi:cytochrome P450 [Rhodococcus sp. NPDC057014]|uniref:cytochrome P450 n=1 Tax=Rhodococcus sp. NPDC057014 TaxID=3346000 RepID=UPI003640D1B2
MIIKENFSVLDPEINQDPFPYFNALREQDPVHWNTRHRAWFLTRYDDVKAGLRDPRLSVDRIRPYIQRRLSAEEQVTFHDTFSLMESFLPFRDPPHHTRLRKIIQAAFTPAVVAKQADGVEQITKTLTENAVAKLRRGETVDLVSDYARPLPATVMARMVHLDDVDSHLIDAWTTDLSLFMGGAVDDPERNSKVHRGVSNMAAHIADVLNNYDGDQTDVVGALLAAEADGDRLTRQEIVATCILMIFAGYRTTACSTANAINQLLGNPALHQQLQADLSLLPAAVEEFMRFEGHARIAIRWAAEEFELHGKTIRPGERVFLVLAAANRDPRQFTDPDRLDIRRHPNQHLGFGMGMHYCLGAPLARIEIASALRSFLSEFPAVTPAGPDRQWEKLLTNRALARLDVRMAQH